MKTRTSHLFGMAIAAAISLHTATGNDNDAFIPEMWANESLAILEENMILGQLVHRDFENEIAEYGDVVNTRKPTGFTAKRKTDDDTVTVQRAKSTNVQVPLNQWIHVSFIIKDGESSKSFKDLVSFYLYPALLAQAQLIDKILSGQTIQFIANNAGQLGGCTTSTADTYTLDAREVMNIKKAPVLGRNLVITPKVDTAFQGTSQFVSAEKRGDGGNALETAELGTLHGFRIFMAQNQPYVSASDTTKGWLVNQAAGFVQGATTLVVNNSNTGAGTITAGTFITVAGDMVPQRVTAATFNANTSAGTLTLTPGLNHSGSDDAAVTLYAVGAVNQANAVTDIDGTQLAASGYIKGYAKEIVLDGVTIAPKVGQPVAIGTQNVYTVVDVTSNTGITLDRPLEAAILNDAAIFFGPTGNYNLAFTRNAIALVCRPLKAPKAGLGALSTVQMSKNFAVRVTITYDGKEQGTLVTVDALCGVAILDTDQGCVMLG